MKNRLLTIFALLVPLTYAANIHAEYAFYAPPAKHSVIKNLVKDYGVDNSFATNDSQKMQRAIDDIAKAGGGKLIVPAGNYSLREIWLKSNVHIEIDVGATIKPSQEGNKKIKPNTKNLKKKLNHAFYKAFVMFNFSSTSKEPLENVSISGSHGRFKIDMSDSENRFNRVFMLRNVRNFYLSDIDIKEDYSKYASIVLNGEEVADYVYSPDKGVIKNIDVTGAHYGYGLVQVQLGTNVLFENLHGTGGSTLRLESHTKNLHDPTKYRAMDNIVGRNIRCTDGNSAVQISPHYVHNGAFDIQDITANGCGWAVRMANAFVNPKEKKQGLTPGSFSSNSMIRDVKATFTADKAQLKEKHHKYLPCEMRPIIAKKPYTTFPGNKSMSGPSYGVILNEAGYYKVDVSKEAITKATGFKPSQLYVTKADAIETCSK